MTVRWIWYGGCLRAARAHFGDGDMPWIDLSTGINPHGWIGEGRAAADARDIDRALHIYVRAGLPLWLIAGRYLWVR